MKFTVITLFPEMIRSLFSEGVVGQAHQVKLIELECLNPRQFTKDVHKTIDDRPFGGGDGMIMMAEPLTQCLEFIQSKQADSEAKATRVIYLSPQGPTLNENKLKELSAEKHLVLICGRYGGIDQRFINQSVDEELSIGDYVISGGELAAAVLIDSLSRKIPGVLGNQSSSEQDSFTHARLEEPSFTRPREYKGDVVPEVLLSGNHQKIKEWRQRMRELTTLKKRPDLLHGEKMDISALKKFWQEMPESEKKALGFENFPPVPGESS